jgi:hypothetical protein
MNIIRTKTAPAHWSKWWLGLWTLAVCVLGVTVFLLPNPDQFPRDPTERPSEVYPR